jgi:hypothetical protein
MTRILAALLVAATAVATAGPAGAPLRIKASPAVVPCVTAAAQEYARATGLAPLVETAAIGSPESVTGADVVVAANRELNRVIESGMTRPDQELDVAEIPWVAAGPPGNDAPSLQSLGRTRLVDVLGGVVAQETWRRLSQQGLQPARSERAGRGSERSAAREPREAVRLQPGEAAVVPLSLAGSAAVTRLDVPPLLARALGVRASQRPEASRAFLDFLAGEKGNAVFRACGRTDGR